ncbi:MAG: MFS transporter [Gammaproteobacteria bacterium]
MGAMLYNILPLFIGAAQDDRGLSDRQVGFVASIFFVGFGLLASTSYFWLRKVNWQKVIIVAVMVAIGCLISITLIPGYTFMLIGILLAGGALGLIYAIGTTILGDTSNPARYFGLKISSEILLGILLLFSLPVLVLDDWGFNGLVITLAGLTLILSTAFFWIPATGVKGAEAKHDPKHSKAPAFAVTVSLLGIFFFYAGMSSVWVYMERLAVDADIADSVIGRVLSASLFVSLCAALSAAALANKLGRRIPIVAGLLVIVLANYMFTLSLTLSTYALAACLFNAAFAFTLPFLIALIASMDAVGRFVILTVPAIAFGNILGPAIAGDLIGSHGYDGVMILAICTTVLTGVLVLTGIKADAGRRKASVEPVETHLV